MLRQASRIWSSSRRPPWLRRAETISPNPYLKCALVLIAVTAAAAGGKRPIASGLANLSLDQFLSVPTDRASMIAILQVVLLIALLLLASRVGRTIEIQRRALEELQMRISQLADRCEELRHRLAAAHIDSVRAYDSFLHDFGLNLRDGPMRLVEEALGELNSLDRDHEAALAGFARIRFALEDALAAIRSTSADHAATELNELSAKG